MYYNLSMLERKKKENGEKSIFVFFRFLKKVDEQNLQNC